VQKAIPDTLAESISMASATDGWATLDKDISAGTNSTPTTRGPLFQFAPLLLHYHQGQWVDETSTISAGGKADMIGAVTMRSPTDGWIHLGLYQGTVDHPVMLLHYDGAVWRTVSLPAIKATFMSIAAIVMISSTEGWAIGYAEAQQKPGYVQFDTPLIVHYQSGVWKVVQH
jgi:hypothetical protein